MADLRAEVDMDRVAAIRRWIENTSREKVHELGGGAVVQWDDSAACIARIDELEIALEDITRVVISETEGHTFGKSGYDITLDHLHDMAVAAREHLS